MRGPWDKHRATGTPAIQVNTGKGCHLDAQMIADAAPRLPLDDNGILFIENVGNHKGATPPVMQPIERTNHTDTVASSTPSPSPVILGIIALRPAIVVSFKTSPLNFVPKMLS